MWDGGRGKWEHGSRKFNPPRFHVFLLGTRYFNRSLTVPPVGGQAAALKKQSAAESRGADGADEE